jgi:hypothetical protein
MGGEETLIPAHYQRDDGAGQWTVKSVNNRDAYRH